MAHPAYLVLAVGINAIVAVLGRGASRYANYTRVVSSGHVSFPRLPSRLSISITAAGH